MMLDGSQFGRITSSVESAVSAHLGRPWAVKRVQDKGDEASHPAAILAGDDYSVFVKTGKGPVALDRLERELSGLRFLSERAGVLTPVPICVLDLEDSACLIMEAMQSVEKSWATWRQAGRGLARVHAVKSPCFGLESHCYWGDFWQDNSPTDDWPEFFWSRRIEPRMRAALASSHLEVPLARKVDSLRSRMDELCGPAVEATLLHGDAHQNNFLHTVRGPALIDPAVYFGHPEVDLASIDFFAPVPEDFFGGYAEINSIDPGFRSRKDLWRIPWWLAMIEVEGRHYNKSLQKALKSYL